MSKKTRQPLLRLATASFKAHSGMHLKLCLVFVLLSVLICLFSAFTMSVADKRAESFAENVSSDYMYAESDKTDFLTANGYADFAHYTVDRYDLSSLMKEHIQADIPTVTANYITLQVNGRKYFYDKDTAPQLLWLFRGDPFNELDGKELKLKFGDDAIYSGTFPKDGTNEVLISEKLLDGYGLKQEDVINKSVRILLGENADTEFDDLKVVGVISRNYYQLSGHGNDNWQIVPSVVAAAKNTIPTVNAKTVTFHLFASDQWSTLSDSQLYNVMSDGEMIYGGINSYNQRGFLDKIEEVVVNIYYIVGSVLIVGLLLTVMLLIDKFVATFSRLSGILLCCGLDGANLYKLLFTQIALMFLLSLPFALVGGLVGYAAIVYLVSLSTGMTMIVSTTTLVVLMAISTVAVAAATAVFFGFALLRLRKKTAKQLLATEAK